MSGAVSGSDRFNESFLAVVGIHRDEDTGKDDDYYWMDLTHYTIDDGGTARTGQEEVISESNRKNSRYGTWISLSLPDIDKDGVRMSYNSQYKIYTEPEVLAVLQDAPYFKDLQDVYDYLVLGGTGYGKSESSSYSNGISVDAELGVYCDMEVEALWGAQISASWKGSASFDYQHENETTFSSMYESHAGEGDKVVVYTIPVVVYVYDIVDEMTGETGSVAMNASLGSQMSVVSVEKYDEVIKGKDRVSIASLLSSQSGYPSTYAVESGDTFGQGKDHVTRIFDYTENDSKKYSGCISEPGATITQSIEQESGDEYGIGVGLKYDFEVGTGPALLGNEVIIGVAGGMAASYEHGWSSSEGVEFEGAVDNLPAQAGDDYAFSWSIGVNAYESDDDSDFDDNTEAFWIIGYDVKNVVEPKAHIVTGVSATAASSDSITLNWDSVISDDSQYQYGIGMLSSDGQKVTSWKIVSQDDQTSELPTSYTWEGLSPDKEYSFVVAVLDQDKNQISIQSETVTSHTFPEGVSAHVEGIDINNIDLPLSSFSSYEATEGDSITLNASGEFSGTTSENNYSWYVKKKGSEVLDVIRSTGTEGEVSSLDLTVTSEDDGNQYYFMVSCDDMYMQTGILKLNVESGEESHSSSYSIDKLRNLIDKTTTYSPVSMLRESGSSPEIMYFDKVDGVWGYYKDGVLDSDYTGLVKGVISDISTESGWYYVENGLFVEYTGIQKNENGWWRVVNGKVDFTATGVYKNEYGWWYCKDGKVQFDYTGIQKNENGWWRIVNGKVDFTATGVYKNEYGWWYCKDGKVQFDYTGIQKNENGWWRIVSGKVDFTATGVYKNEYGWWYCKGGKVQFDYTGIQKNENGWWRIVSGKVDFTATGVYKNEYGWWYCKNGKVQFDYTGYVKSNGKTYYVVNGKVK